MSKDRLSNTPLIDQAIPRSSLGGTSLNGFLLISGRDMETTIQRLRREARTIHAGFSYSPKEPWDFLDPNEEDYSVCIWKLPRDKSKSSGTRVEVSITTMSERVIRESRRQQDAELTARLEAHIKIPRLTRLGLF